MQLPATRLVLGAQSHVAHNETMAIPETTTAAVALLIKATILAAKWAGIARRRALATIANSSDDISEFSDWYNGWRPHSTLGGACPNDVYARDLPELVPRSAKTLPPKIERRHFAEARVTGFRLPKVA